MKTSFILMFFSLTLHAEDCINCSGAYTFPVEELQNQIDALQKPAIVDCNVEKKAAAEKEYLEHFAKLPKKNGVVKGLPLTGSAPELKFLAKMLGDTPTEKWPEARGCNTVICALEKIYNSKEAAHRVLNIAMRDGYIVSASKGFSIDNKPAGQLFTENEIQQIDLAYKELPKKFKKLKSLDRIIRMPAGKINPKVPKAAAYATPGYRSSYYSEEGEIVFLDSTFDSTPEWGPNVAVHELAHHVDFSRSDKTQFGLSEDNKDFLKLSGWKKSTKYETNEKTGKKVQVIEWTHDNNKKFITDYAATEPAEDFAESVAHYMYTPHKLKAIDPEKYNYIKTNIFEGREYLNEPQLGLSKEEVVKKCLEGVEKISFWGGYSTTKITQNCLNAFANNFLYTDASICKYNTSQIQIYLADQISAELDDLNKLISGCDEIMAANRKQCYGDGDFRKTCPANRCELPEQLKSKVKDNSYDFNKPKAINVLKAKMGKENFIAYTLLNGLSDKKAINPYNMLIYDSNFLKKASAALNAKMESLNFQFDNKENDLKETDYNLMFDPDAKAAISTFQTDVLMKATRSRENNLALIKTWAQKMQLNDTELYEELAENLRKFK